MMILEAKNNHLGTNSLLDVKLKRLFLESIDECMSTLGETVKATIIFILKRKFNINMEEVIEKPEEFVYALRSTIGSKGSQILENLILMKFHSKLGLKYERSENKEFAEYIGDACRKFRNIK
ncbi:MAG: NitrOD5 domain-containing protein [Candidatus Bathyarchaeia archaeon]